MGTLDPQPRKLINSSSGIKVVGLDLDGTLYPSTPEIQQRIRTKIYEKIAKEFEINYDRAKNLFEEDYKESHSGSKTIEQIALKYQKQILGVDLIQSAIEEADILDFIKEDSILFEMLQKIKKQKQLDLITGSEKSLAYKKLDRLGLPQKLFQNIITRDQGSKITTIPYELWLRKTGQTASEHLYIGDNKKQDVDIPKSLGITTCIIGQYENADFQIQSILDLESLLIQ